MMDFKRIVAARWPKILGILVLAALGEAYIFGMIDAQTAAGVGTLVGALTGVTLSLGLDRTEEAARQVDEADAADDAD